MVEPKVAQLIQQFDQATDGIAARIQRLIDQGGIGADSVAALQAEVTKLQALGEDPNNPVPVSVVGGGGNATGGAQQQTA